MIETGRDIDAQVAAVEDDAGIGGSRPQTEIDPLAGVQPDAGTGDGIAQGMLAHAAEADRQVGGESHGIGSIDGIGPEHIRTLADACVERAIESGQAIHVRTSAP